MSEFYPTTSDHKSNSAYLVPDEGIRETVCELVSLTEIISSLGRIFNNEILWTKQTPQGLSLPPARLLQH